MIPALPTVAPEMEHHRGFQTFAAPRGIVRAAAISAAGAWTMVRSSHRLRLMRRADRPLGSELERRAARARVIGTPAFIGDFSRAPRAIGAPAIPIRRAMMTTRTR
jgi:hypothetical protein